MHISYFAIMFGVLYVNVQQASIKSESEKWLKANGCMSMGTGSQNLDFSNRAIGGPGNFMYTIGHFPVMASDVIISPSRNQAYRKYFEMNQKYSD